MSPPPDGNILPFAAATRRCGQCGLRHLCLATGAAPHTLARLDQLVEYRPPLEPGEALYHAGASMRAVYMVRSGTLKSVAQHEDGSEQVLGFHLPGELVGLDGFGSGFNTCHVEALEHTLVCVLPWRALQNLAATEPSVRDQAFAAIGRETLDAHRHLSMMGQPVPRRLGMFLIDLMRRRARLDPLRIHLPMSRSEIGNYLGVVEETVCRQFSRLQLHGVLDVSRRWVHILDAPRLLDPPLVDGPASGRQTRRLRTGHR
jgi:CRP/FNR family transcriptional regulator, anaerobic regulatory protein